MAGTSAGAKKAAAKSNACALCTTGRVPANSKYAACTDCRKKHAGDPLMGMFFRKLTKAEQADVARKRAEQQARNRAHDENMRTLDQVTRLKKAGDFDAALELLNTLPPYYRGVGRKVSTNDYPRGRRR